MRLNSTIRRILETVAEETLNPDYEQGGECMFCGLFDGHDYDCISQQARIILGMPLLKTKIERQWEDIKGQERYHKWREENPEEAARNDKFYSAWLGVLVGRDNHLWDLVRRTNEGEQTTYEWVENG